MVSGQVGDKSSRRHPSRRQVESATSNSATTAVNSATTAVKSATNALVKSATMIENGNNESLKLRYHYKGMVLYSAVSSPLDRSKRFTLSSPGRPVHSDTVLGFSWKHSSHAAIAQRLFTHIPTTVYSQVLIYTAESTEAS